MWYVYILLCSNGEYYKGCTSNLEERMERHNKGWVEATKKSLTLKLITYVVFTDKYKAYEFEKYLKSGSGRAFFKEAFDLNVQPSPKVNFSHCQQPSPRLRLLK